MANVKFKLPLDNTVKDGDQVLTDLVNQLAGAAGGHENIGKAEHVRDPITNKLVQVILTLPESASANAKAAIDANPGIVTTQGGIQPSGVPLVRGDLDPTAGIAVTGAAAGLYRIFIFLDPTAGPGSFMGYWQNGTYVFDAAPVIPAPGQGIYMSIQHDRANAIADVTIASGEITLNFATSGGPEAKPIQLVNPIVMDGKTNDYGPRVRQFFIDDAGFMYPWRDQLYNPYPAFTLVTHAANFDDAVLLGAL